MHLPLKFTAEPSVLSVMQTMASFTLVAWTEKDGFSYSVYPGWLA